MTGSHVFDCQSRTSAEVSSLAPITLKWLLTFVLDVASTVRSTPVHVAMVKLDADVLSTVPVAPPSAARTAPHRPR